MHKFWTYLFLSLLFYGAQVDVLAQNRNTQNDNHGLLLEKQIDSIVASAIVQEAFPGCVVYAKHQDSVLFFKSYGYHTYDSVISVKKDDIYDLASITKIAGATLAMMKLYDDGLITLDDPIKNYVNRFGGKAGKVTIRQALSHYGGLKSWIPYHQVIRKKNGSFRKKDIVTIRNKGYSFALTDSLHLSDKFYAKRIKKLIRRSKIQKNPSYKYSGLFFYLIPEIVLNRTGMSFPEYLNDMFYDPLKTKTIGFNPDKNFNLHRVPPTEVDTFFRMEKIHGKVHDEGAIMMRGISGNAGLFSNAEDLASIMTLFIHTGKMGSVKFLSSSTVSLFTTAQYSNVGNRRGLGFDKPLLVYDSLMSSVAKDASLGSYGHTGYTGTLAWADPRQDLIYIFLSNRVYPTRENKSLYELNVRPTIHQLFYDYLKAQKIKKVSTVQTRN